MGEKHKVCAACGFIGQAQSQTILFIRREVKCPKCNKASMTELRSRKGQTILAKGQTWADYSNILGAK